MKIVAETSCTGDWQLKIVIRRNRVDENAARLDEFRSALQVMSP
jgi:hypothetical protein